MTTAALMPNQTSQTWWREPYIWLVIGGPLVVVCAAIATAAIAFKGQDPVLDKNNAQQAEMMKRLIEAKATKEEMARMQPAMQGRNHAASPLLPKPVNDR